MAIKTRATIKDIAKIANVSTATVSQALRPREGSNIKLPPETVEKVKAAAKKLNYRAHAGARSTRAKNFNSLGFFTSKYSSLNHSPDGYQAGVHDAAEKKGFTMIQIRLPQSVDDIQTELPSILDERNLDALVLSSYHNISSILHSRLESENLPIIYLNDRHPTNSVFVDEVEGSQTMTRHLIKRGYKKITFVIRKPRDEIPLSSMHHSAQERIEGYTQTMQDAGLSPVIRTVFANQSIGKNHEFPPEWRSWVEESDALFAYDDDLANQFGRLLYKHHLRIPDDVALAGYNGDYGAYSAWQDLTTMRIPSYEMGIAAFEIAHALIENGNSEQIPSRRFSPTLVTGNSTR